MCHCNVSYNAAQHDFADTLFNITLNIMQATMPKFYVLSRIMFRVMILAVQNNLLKFYIVFCIVRDNTWNFNRLFCTLFAHMEHNVQNVIVNIIVCFVIGYTIFDQ